MSSAVPLFPDYEPLPFSSKRFKEMWELFKEHRKEVGSPMTETAKKLMLNDLKDYTEEEAIAELKRSALAGWRGLHPEEKPTPYKERMMATQKSLKRYKRASGLDREAVSKGPKKSMFTEQEKAQMRVRKERKVQETKDRLRGELT